MRDYLKNENELLFIYLPEYEYDSVIKKINCEDGFHYKNCFFLKKNNVKEINDNDEITFIIGYKNKDDYYDLDKEIFGIENNFSFHQSVILKDNYFFQSQRISVIRHLSDNAKCDIRIVPEKEMNLKKGDIPLNYFKELIKSFPNTREMFLYQHSCISTIVGDFFEENNYIKKYNDYVSKHRKITKENISMINRDLELEKYEIIISKLKEMLKKNYSEKDWQEQLLPTILLLYPKYILCLKKVNIISDIQSKKRKELDYLLVDCDGNIDIIEIKKPFEDCVLRKGLYRNNYIPGRELTGAIQQVEKYLFYLNTLKYENEKSINKNYADELKGIKVKLINPQGLIICGRSNKFNDIQKTEYEIIKRQYKSVTEIITYDELIIRLENSIKIFKTTC